MDFDPYREAVIHLAWYRDHRVNHLLFALVELRPAEFPPATPCTRKGFRAHGAAGKDYQFVHYQRFVLPVDSAVAWVRDAASGSAAMPDDKDTDLVSGPFLEEPPWPHFVTCSAAEALPFAPDWMRGSRVHFLFPRRQFDPTIRQILPAGENPARLADWLNFDLVVAFDDYQGAICLVAPNPLFRSVEKSHLEAPAAAPGETVAYRLTVRHGQRPAGCRLEVATERLRGRMEPLVHEFDDIPIADLRHPAVVYKEGVSVMHPVHGLLHWYQPGVLTQVVRLGTEIVRRVKRVRVPARGRRRPSYTLDIEELEDAGGTSVGDLPDDADVIARLVAAQLRRERQQTAGDYDQQWFHQVPNAAAEWVRQKIGDAHEAVFIVDPYFAGPELFAFGHAITRPDVGLRILTSVEAFDDETAAHDLLANLNATAHVFSTPPEIRVLTGTPEVHDRFLVVDGRAWLSGNSLNTLGERAGMIIRLPDPEPVVARLRAFWQGAQPLADWLAARPGQRNAGDDE